MTMIAKYISDNDGVRLKSDWFFSRSAHLDQFRFLLPYPGLVRGTSIMEYQTSIIVIQENIEDFGCWIKRSINLLGHKWRSRLGCRYWRTDIYHLSWALQTCPNVSIYFPLRLVELWPSLQASFRLWMDFPTGFYTKHLCLIFENIFCQNVLTLLFRFFGWGGEDDNFFQRLAHKVSENLLFQDKSM